ncbi:hypothetical protein Bca52824_012456 [Brassica carinata]|uniref:Uncharacterized protein n=1 Tax=Brassica carinata TaxID=52824 RepID=A0A8X7VYU7_BRACI|nr:hypothetical protein Bca52824_012456 [Brassica carinata]
MFDRGRGMLRAAGRGMLRAAGRGVLGAAGRGMLRAAGRAMKRTGVAKGGVQDPFASSSPAGNASVSLGGGYVHKFGSNNLRISAASGSLLNLPVATTSRWSGGAFSFSSSGVYGDFDWVTVEGTEEEEEEDSVFSSVPSVDEVEDAVSALKQVFDGSSYSQMVRDKYQCNPENGGGDQSLIATGTSFEPELDWVEPSMELCHSRILQPRAYDHVYNAFDLLRTDPSVQRMVLSLSSDKAVWNAVRNNEVVQEIKELYYNGINQDEESSDDESSDEESSDDTPRENDAAIDFIKWVFDSTVVKATEVLKKIINLVIELLNSFKVNKKRKRGKFNNWFEEDLKTSVFLSILVMLVVIVSRARNMSMIVPSC